MSNAVMIQSIRERGYVRSKRVEEAMLAVDRACFIPGSAYPYNDSPYPVGKGQTISAPSVVGFMLEHLAVQPGMRVLEVGSGSGYNAALLSHLVGDRGKVISIEVIPELHELAGKNLVNAGFTSNVELVTGDGSKGYPEGAPYDRIIVTCAMPYLDKDHPLLKQLKEDGLIVAPVGERYSQDLVVYHKDGTSQKVLPVIFVPLIGEYGFKGSDGL